MWFRPSAISLQSPAKINASLRVVSKRDDGYHELEMINLPLELHDVVVVQKDRYAEDTFVTCDDIEIGNLRYNLCHKAVDAMREEFGFKDQFLIRIHKNIPFAAGLGGGSSNAAATIKAVSKLVGINPKDERVLKVAAKVGADVPFFMDPGPRFVTGFGDKSEPISLKDKWTCLIVRPRIGLSTKAVFDEWDKRKLESSVDIKPVMEALMRGDLLSAGALSGNDLEKVSTILVPEITKVLARLNADGFEFVRMTGSGSSVFALTKNDELARLSAVKYENEGYIVCITKTTI